MTIDELLNSGLAELVRGTVRARRGDQYVVIARQNGDMMAVTEEGRSFLARTNTSLEEVAAPTKPKRKVSSEVADLGLPRHKSTELADE